MKPLCHANGRHHCRADTSMPRAMRRCDPGNGRRRGGGRAGDSNTPRSDNLRMEKVAYRTTLHGADGTLRYWLSRSPAERIAAVEELRRRHLGLTDDDVEPRLQRVCRVAQRQRG